MSLPEPHPGLVIRYAYLWADEHHAGRESGIKDRPCAIVLARQLVEDRVIVTVVAVTHSPPSIKEEAIAIPPPVKRLLGLDEQPSWIVLSEVNDFLWPGPDLAPLPDSNPTRFDYGVLPPSFFRTLRDQILALAETRSITRIKRTE